MDDFTDPRKDMPNTREFKHNNLAFAIERRDPYGFWFIKAPHPKMKLNPVLKGAFTSPEKAEEAILQHVIPAPSKE